MKPSTYLSLSATLILCALVATTNLDAQIEKSDWGQDNQVIGDEAFTEPIESIDVAAAEAGIISAVNVKLGQEVAEGDLMLEMNSAVIEASLRIAQSKANNKARLRAAEIEYETKAKRYNEIVRLVKEGAGSPQEAEKAKADADVARQSAEAIIEEGAQFALEVKQYEAQMERRRVRSPIQGVVVELKKKRGEHVNGNEPQVAKVVQLKTLRCVYYLPTEKAAKLVKGDVVEILLTETAQRTPAVVEYVAPITNADSGRVRVDVLIDNESGQFRSGVRARIQGLIRHSSLSSPSQFNR